MSSPTQRAPRLFDFLLLPVLYYVAAKAGVTFTLMPEGTAIVWPPNGFLLAALIRFGGRGYVGFAGLTILAEVIADVPRFSVVEALLFGVSNVGEATIALWLLKRWDFNARFTAPADLLKFVVAGPLIAAFAAAWLAALTYEVFRGTQTGYLEFLRIWWFGDAVGLMIVTPLLLSFWAARNDQPVLRLSAKPLGDALVVLGALGAIALLFAARDGILAGMHVGPILLVPFVIYAAVRYGLTGGALAAAGVALVTMILTTKGWSLFGQVSSRTAVIQAQEFILITSVLALGLASLLSQLRTSKGELQLANRDLRDRAQALEHSNLELQRAEAEVVALNAGLERRVQERTSELELALTQVKRLQGLLPICAWCNKVRDDEDYWQSVEDYIVKHTDARFSHSICPDCTERVLREARGRTA